MIEIHGITPAQAEKLDRIWNIDTEEELVAFLSGLDEADRREYNTLARLAILAQLDSIVDEMREMPAAEYFIKRAMK
jgi:hypothetical protein